jgi:AcrR family transcriptional regulator
LTQRPTARNKGTAVADPRTTSANRILDTALDLFSARGYEATSVREICEAACITKPTLYYFYGSKEGVFRALVHGALEELKQDLIDALARPEPLTERLKLMTRNFFADASRRRKLWRFIASSMWMPDASHAADLPCAYHEYCERIGAALDAAVASGELMPGPTDIRLLVLLGSLGEALDRFLLFDEPPLTRELADQLIDVIVTGWLARSSTSPASASPASSSPMSSSSTSTPLSSTSSSPSSSRSL